MSAISWAFGVSGDWSNGLYWTGGVAPGAGDDVTIAATGTYTVTVSTADAAHSLLLSDAGATVALNNGGTLTIGATLSVTAGALQLNYGSNLNIGSTLNVAGGTVLLDHGGTINGGTLSAGGGSFVWNGGALSGVTYLGPLTLAPSAVLRVGAGGLAVEGAGGHGAGLVMLTGAYSLLDFTTTQTFDNATIDLGSATPPPRYGAGPELATDATLTLGPHVQIDQVAKYGQISGQGVIISQGTINANYANGVGFIGVLYTFPNKIKLAEFNNQGLIKIDNGEYFGLESQKFENHGTISVNNKSKVVTHQTYDYESGPGKEQTITNYGDISITNSSSFIFDDSFSTFSNRGTISVQAGSTFEMVGDISNSGTITATGATLAIDGSSLNSNVTLSGSGVTLWFGLSATQLDLLENKGDTITLSDGALNNGGDTLSVGRGSGLGNLTLVDGAMINGGTVADADGGGIVFKDGGVSGVVYEGALDLSGASSYLNVGAGGIVLTGAGGTGTGLLDLNSQTGTIGFAIGYQTLDNATIDLGGGHAVMYQRFTPRKNGQLDLGVNLTIVQTGSYADIGGGAIFNQGTIDAGGAGAQFDVTASFFQNQGVIDVSGGGVADLRSLSNQSGAALTGGTFEADAGSTLTLDTADQSSLTTDGALIILSGSGSVFQTIDGGGLAHSLDSTLATIAVGGGLELLAGRGWSSTVAMTNAGILKLGGGTFSPSSLTSNGVVTGFGVIATTLTNNGVVEVDAGQMLSLVGGGLTNLSGTTLTGGVIVVNAGSTLQLANDTSIGRLAATLVLDANGSTVQGYDTTTSMEVGIKSSLTAISESGVLELLDGRNFAASNAIGNMGVLQLGGGTFSGGALSDATGSTLTGFGAVACAFTDSGVTTAVGGALAFSGAGDVFNASLDGTEIDFTGGTDLLAGGSNLTAASVALSGGAVVTLDNSLTFSGAFSETGATLALGSGASLSLTGAATFGAGATLAGTGAVSVSGTVDGTGTLTLGAHKSDRIVLSIAAGAIYELDGDVGIAAGARKASLLDGGVLIKSAGTGESVVGANITDSGLIEAATGTLDLTQALTGSGALKIDSGATLELDAAAAKTLTATFNGTDATLALGSVATFASAIAGFASGDVLDLLKTAATGAVLETGGRLLITNGSQTVATLHLVGAGKHDTFTVTSDGHGGSNIVLAATSEAAPPPSGAAFTAQMSMLCVTRGVAEAASPPGPTPQLLHLTAPGR